MISVIIPVYNGGKFVEFSYKTITSQNVEDIELIYVNNNSTDHTQQEIERISKLDQRVTALQQPKQGAAAARNMGIKKAKGDFIYVFDVDDELFPDALNEMCEILQSRPELDAVFGKLVKSHERMNETHLQLKSTNEVILKEKPYWGLIWLEDLSKTIGPPGFLYRKRVFDQIGYYNEEIRNNEDTALDILLGMECNIAFYDRYVYLYYKHPDSTIETSKRLMDRSFMQWPRLYKAHLPYYLNQNSSKEFENIFLKKMYTTMAKMLLLTKGKDNRAALYKKLQDDIRPIKMPTPLHMSLKSMVYVKSELVYKLISYYIIPRVI